MDMFVPSPGMAGSQYISSPNCSIYDQDKIDISSVCGNQGTFSNSNMDSVKLEDMSCLDDLENSSLKSLLTTDVINSLQNPAYNAHSSFLCQSKDEKNPSTVRNNADFFGHNPTLTQINMEPDMTFVNDLLSGEMSSYDLMSDINCSFDSMSNSSTPKPCPTQTSCSSLSSSSTENSNNPSNRFTVAAGQTYTSNAVLVKNNFPPRTYNPPLVGVVAPVKQTTPDEVDNILHKSSELTVLGELEDKKPTSLKLLGKEIDLPSTVSGFASLKSHLETKKLASPSCEMPAQIVPTSSHIKMEPVSPKSALKRHLGQEETMEEKWKDIQKFITDPQTAPEIPPHKKRKRCDSGSSGHISDDEDDEDVFNSINGSKDDGEDSDDDMSDIDADLAHIRPSDNCESLIDTGKKQKQFFWQYNVQSKGPKGTRLKLAVESPADPHVLNDFEDPVFDECNTSIAGIRHGGKARKGDGNEITPNPRKLYLIGHMLNRLNDQINACQLGPDVPVAKRNQSKKEKNKLASRACRLKKKAQHEANKIKLYGLKQEHSQLNSVFSCIWPELRNRAKALLAQQAVTTPSVTFKDRLNTLVASNLKDNVAGNTTDYVNSVILKFERGDKSGGMNIREKQKS